MKQLNCIIIPLIVIFFTTHAPRRAPVQQPVITVQYIGNMGVWVTVGDKKFLIDALHTEYRPAYLFPPTPLADSIVAGEGEYSGMQAALVTHVHRDHFSADLISRLLKQQPHTTAIVPVQAIDSFTSRKEYAGNMDRITAVQKQEQTGMILAEGFRVYTFTIEHTYRQRHSGIQHVGYIIDVNGKRVFHAGDADTAIELYQRLKLREYAIDVAILPAWLLCSENGKRITEEFIRAKHIIVTHIEPGEAGAYITECRKRFPEAVFFTALRQQATF